MTRRQIALTLILIVDVGYIAWGAGAAASPEHLLGPGGKGILPAAYEGYSGRSWSELASAAPRIAGYVKVLYRMYGVYCTLFGLLGSTIALTAYRRGERWAWWALLVSNTVALVSAITMDRMSNAIGPFAVTEYIGLMLVWGALAVTAPFRAAGRPIPSTA